MTGMAPHHVARLRLAALCVAVFASSAFLAMTCHHALDILLLGRFNRYAPNTLAAFLGLMAGPALLVAPIVGPMAGSRWNRFLLIGSPVVLLLILIVFSLEKHVAWLSLAGLASVTGVFFVSAVFGSVSTIARTTQLDRTMVIYGLGLAAIFAFPLSYQYLEFQGQAGENTLVIAVALAAAQLILVYLARFPIDWPTANSRSLFRAFVSGIRATLNNRYTGPAYIGLCSWFVIFSIAIGPGFRVAQSASLQYQKTDIISLFVTAFIIGALVPGLFRNAFRQHGFILIGATCVFPALFCEPLYATGFVGPLRLGAFGLGISICPLISCYLTWAPSQREGIAISLLLGSFATLALAEVALIVNLGPNEVVPRMGDYAEPLRVFESVAIFAAGLWFFCALFALFRPALELTFEILIWPIYRISAVGPGVAQLPDRGPCLVIANHAAWLDPLFVAKILPAPTLPMMTSTFYDLPIIWFLMRIIGTIRVPNKAYRHEAPELKEAVEALNRGEAVVLFPEGYLRRKEEMPLRRFGRGVWQILHDRPNTPVYCCWIDGNWGSFTSFKNGPPTKKKRLDFWRRIRIGVRPPILVDPKLLDDHLATRNFLMREVAAAREYLGLPPLDLPSAPDGDEA